MLKAKFYQTVYIVSNEYIFLANFKKRTVTHLPACYFLLALSATLWYRFWVRTGETRESVANVDIRIAWNEKEVMLFIQGNFYSWLKLNGTDFVTISLVTSCILNQILKSGDEICGYNNIINIAVSPNQHDFMLKKSTVTNLACIMQFICNN